MVNRTSSISKVVSVIDFNITVFMFEEKPKISLKEARMMVFVTFFILLVIKVSVET